MNFRIFNFSIIFFIYLSLFSSISRSQIVYSESNNTPHILKFDNYNITEKKYDSKIIGSAYIYEDWKAADIKMTTDSAIYQDILIKVDILNNLIEIKDANEIKILPEKLTGFFIIKETDEIFITKNKLNNCILNGFSKVLYNGKTSLLSNYSARIKKANYNIALDVGNRNDEIIIEKKYFLLINKELKEVNRNKKKFIDSFAFNSKIQDFIKEKNISPKNENDLIALLTFIDSIL
ncbi:MAG: hypothetical protein ACOYO1_01470 [Bacteroidales bacterium]